MAAECQTTRKELMEIQELFMIWSLVALGIMVLVLYALVVALRAALRRNERLTMMLAVREAHGGKGTDAARAHVATIKELNKKYADAAAAGLVPPAEERKKKGSLHLRQTTP